MKTVVEINNAEMTEAVISYYKLEKHTTVRIVENSEPTSNLDKLYFKLSEFVKQDKKILAIKLLRTETNCGLKEGKTIVDMLFSNMIFGPKDLLNTMKNYIPHYELTKFEED